LLLYSSVHVLLAAICFFAILTLWVPGRWPVAVFEIGIFALASVAVVRARRGPFPFSWPLIPLSLAVLWGLAQLFAGTTVYPFETRNATVQWTACLAAFFVGLSVFRSAPARRWFRSAMLWFGFLVAVVATLQSLTAGGRIFWIFPTEYTDYVMGPILYRNHYAAFIEVVLPLALYEALRRERSALLYSVAAAAMYASVIASASRAGTILTTAEILAVPLLLWSRGRTDAHAVRSSILRLAVVVAFFAVVVGPEAVWTRFWAPDPYSMRREFAISSLHMIAAHPWFGSGLGTWPVAYPAYAIIDIGAFANQAHSDWLQWAAEGGIPFALAIATMFAWAVRPAFRSVWGIGVLAVSLHACVDYPFSRPALAAWPILLLSLLASTDSSPRKPSDAPPPPD